MSAKRWRRTAAFPWSAPQAPRAWAARWARAWRRGLRNFELPSRRRHPPFGDPRRRLAELSSDMNWKVADAVPYDVLNQVLWADMKGTDSKMPEPRETTLVVSGVQHAAQSGDGDD